MLRKQTPDPPIYPRQGSVATEVEIQYRVMEALAAHSDVPVAPLVGYEGDAAILGAPFFVMGHVDGEVTVENPPYPVEGFFAEASPRAEAVAGPLRPRGARRGPPVDWQAAGLDWLAPVDGAPGTASRWSCGGRTASRSSVTAGSPSSTTRSPGSPPACPRPSRSGCAGATGVPAT